MAEQIGSLQSMLSPKSIAIIGASGDKSKIGHKPVANLKEVGYEGKVYLVNPSYREIAGYPCYKNIGDLPLNIDLALVSVSAFKVHDVLEDLYQSKVKSIVLFSAGFAEIGTEGEKEEKKLIDFSTRTRIPICGPNTLGITNFKERAIVSFSSLKLSEHVPPIAFVTQSGAMGSLIYTLAKEMGQGFHYFVSSGNEASVDFFDYVSYFAREKEIKVVGGYLEGARDYKKMASALQFCQDAKKPLVLMKVGNSEKGAEAASSHTASLAGNAEVYKSYLKNNNVVRVEDEEELTDTLTMFTRTKEPNTQGGVAIVTQSGGAGIVMTDQCDQKNIPLAELSVDTKDALKEILPKFATAKNPIDTTPQLNQTPEKIVETVKIAMKDDNVESVILYLQMTDESFLPILPKLSKLAQTTNKIFVLCWAGIQHKTKEALLAYKDICWIPNPTRTVNALANVMNYYNSQTATSIMDERPRITQMNTAQLKRRMNEWESKLLMKQYGVSVPESHFIKNKEGLRNINFNHSMVVKAVSADLKHKSDYGLVKLNISSIEEAEQAYEDIVNNSQIYCTNTNIEGLLVEQMSPQGIEVIVGAVQDKVFGPCIMFGLGGIFVEVLKDVVVMPAPLTEEQALKMVKSIKGYGILKGDRSNVTYDISALVDALVRISEFCRDNKDDLLELDINPLVVHEEGQGVTAVDALIIGS